MAGRSSSVLACILCLASVGVITPPTGAQPLTCGELRDRMQEKFDAHEAAAAEFAGLSETEICLMALTEAFAGDPPQLPPEAIEENAACLGDQTAPTPQDIDDQLTELRTVLHQKRDQVGDLLIEYEEVKGRFDDGCS